MNEQETAELIQSLVDKVQKLSVYALLNQMLLRDVSKRLIRQEACPQDVIAEWRNALMAEIDDTFDASKKSGPELKQTVASFFNALEKGLASKDGRDYWLFDWPEELE